MVATIFIPMYLFIKSNICYIILRVLDPPLNTGYLVIKHSIYKR